MIDRKLTQQLQQWLEAKAEDRDIATGAMLLRRLVRNLTFAANFERNPKRHMKMAEYQLSKYLPMRLAQVTHEDVVRMTKKVKEINEAVTVERNGLIGGSFKSGYWKVETVLGNPAETQKGNIAGTGSAARLQNPQDIVLAPDGNFWITTRLNNFLEGLPKLLIYSLFSFSFQFPPKLLE